MTQRINIENTKKETILLYDFVGEDLLKESSNLKKEGFIAIEEGILTNSFQWGTNTLYYQYMSKDEQFRPKQSDEEIRQIIMTDIASPNLT